MPAQKKLATLLEKKMVKGNQKARVLHNLGMVHFMKRRHEKALVYLSRVLTEHGKSPYVKNALFHIGKSLWTMNKPKEANAAFNRLIKKYPKSSQAKKAKKLIK